jgi:hypothetical protein
MSVETRLAELGDALDLDDRDIAEAVLRRLDEPAPVRRRRFVVVAAAIVAIVLAAVVLYPGSRHALANWLGLDGLGIERRPGLEVPSAPAPFEYPGPGDSKVVEVDGRQVLVSTIEGGLGENLIHKVVGSSTSIVRVSIDGHPGLWIDGAPHNVFYETRDGKVVIERVAGDTLLWQDGVVLHRVEGFDDSDSAIAFAESGT